jgi:broad specificity phosphatase PhoE
VAMKQKSVTVTLIECGPTSWSADGRIQGSADLPLTGDGLKVIEQAAAWLRMSRAATVYHPGDDGATATAQECGSRLHAKTKLVEELADPHLGLLEGLTDHDFAERFPTRHRQWESDPLSLTPPEGEPMIEATDRLCKAVAKIIKKSRGEEVAIVLHSLGLGILRCWFTHRPMSEIRVISQDRPPIERFVFPLELLPQLENAAADIYAAS